ncbi:MAG: BRO-N domain-containing protein [Fusobacteriaceae bacterium]
MNSLALINNLNFESSLVRTYDKGGEILFCLADCLKAINSKTHTTAGLALIYDGLGDGYVTNVPIVDSMGREQEVVFIAESALTFLIARSRTELGKKFNRWIHCDILPSIRKTGSYSTKPVNTMVEYSNALHIVQNARCSEALKQLLLDKMGDELATAKALLSPAKEVSLIGVAQKAEQMGYTLTHSNRGILGKFVKGRGLNPISEDRLVNGQLRKCLVYEDNLALESAITDFFSQNG